jgi:Rad3-related DNA helicase
MTTEKAKHQDHLDLTESFPWDLYPVMLDNQERALDFVSKNENSLLEIPTGSGKTAIGYTFLRQMEKQGIGPLFYITPNKTLVNQVKDLHPDVCVSYGRNEYDCLFYGNGDVKADEAPCSMLNCPHRVNMETGETEILGSDPCPYLEAKHEAMKGRIVICTMSFYLFTHLFSRGWGEPSGLVIDEVHKMASVVRNSLSYDITDLQLNRIIDLFKEIGTSETKSLKNFRNNLVKIVKSKPKSQSTLLEDYEISELLLDLYQIDSREIRSSIREAIRIGKVDAFQERETLKKVETITRSLSRYLKSLEFSLSSGNRRPLNYTYAYFEREEDSVNRANYKLTIKAYHVAPIIKKILARQTVAYSATVGDPEILGFETGIKFPFLSLSSDFPSDNAKIFIPTDTPNLAMKSRRRQDLTRTLRKIAKACKVFKDAGHRSLVVVVSNFERDKFLMLCKEESVDAISYGNGVKPRQAAEKFKNGKGDVLVGTVANYGEGVDLPKQIAPIIFFLRPGYASPSDPASVFEERRFGSMRWRQWNWRVMMEALQVRGRNVRSAEDIGVTFFVSQQFRRFLAATLPEWMRPSYEGKMKFEECVQETLRILK